MDENKNAFELTDEEFLDFKSQQFAEYAQNKSLLFNFFLENNDIFKCIDYQDEYEIQQAMHDYKSFTCFSFGFSLLSVLLLDQGLFRLVNPPFRVEKFRACFTLFKYAAIPLTCLMFAIDFGQNKLEEVCLDKAEKYNFSYFDYEKQMTFLNKVRKAGLINELNEKRDLFDFTKIPEEDEEEVVQEKLG